MTVKLMLTCLCDAFYGEVGIATVRVLEHAGCVVEFPAGQTCCGQPPFNAGDWASARKVAEHWKEVFPTNSGPVVTPSSSCAAMIGEGYPLLFGQSSSKVFELSQFLVHELGVTTWPVSPPPESKPPVLKLAFHRACHGRAIHLSNEQETLLRSISGVELIALDQPEQCCGFGGAFSVNHPTVSAGIGEEKLRHAVETGAAVLVSGDMGCLMHLRGLIDRQGLPLQTRHFAEILADAIPAPVASALVSTT